MGLICSIGGCSLKVRSSFGKEKEYTLFGCTRCGKEEILCSKEGKFLKNDEQGLKVLDMMMNNPEFSRQCAIHSEFIKAELDHTFNFAKCEKAKSLVREKHGLPEGYIPADPVILFNKGLWKPSDSGGESKPSKSKKTAKPKPKSKKGDKPFRLEDGENSNRNYNDVVKVEIRISNKNDRKPGEDKGHKEGEKYSNWVNLGKGGIPKEDLSVEAQISRLERRMDKHVAREEYEKAAKLRDQIAKLKGEN